MSYLNKNLYLACFVLVFTGCSIVKNIPYYPSKDFQTKSINNSSSMHKATMKPYTINGKTYYPTVVEVGDTASGIASWYGPNFHGKKTSNGENYNMNAMTAAHKTLPMNTMVKVLNLKNGKTTLVRINDRGPFVAGRIIDLSKAAANEISMIGAGTAPVRLEVVGFYGKVETPSNKSATTHTYAGGNFMVQIGAFRKKTGADSYNKEFDKTNGYRTTVRNYVLDSEPIYRVFLTGFRSEDEARDFISSGKFKGAFIVRD
ncbi:rare lipoprotein a rlpa [Campylobacter hyointestinalis subsp. hyointestinalis]|uniref:Probable endolytic peptidoglycan transglycosylase RlpA n=1 Tax=Campylobacter hyointestinalis subsp. hyointestinalis TaxID=91352 RepID=A0A0S4RLC7_CAMHY|nr:rare lipoprotein a rlpa [Campylobacter hyointestinalis subsp. hyointestinalis]